MLRQDELAALLSAVLTGTTLLMLFVLRKLGGVLAERENMKLNQGALLKQVCDDGSNARTAAPLSLIVILQAVVIVWMLTALWLAGAQVQGLNAEYNRLSKEQSGATARADAEVEVTKLKSALDAAKKDKQQAEVSGRAYCDRAGSCTDQHLSAASSMVLYWMPSSTPACGWIVVPYALTSSA